MDLADVLKALADPNRLRIVNLLEARSLCVCDLEKILQLQQSNLSRHLAKLKQAGLVQATKQGLFMHYSRSPLPSPLDAVVQALVAAFAADSVGQNDLRQVANQPSGCAP